MSVGVDDMTPRPVTASATTTHYQIFIKDVNPIHTVFGGKVMAEMDRIAGIVATKHSGKVCVTLGADNLRFISPAYEGELLVLSASANRSWNTSLEIGVKIFAENMETGERRHVLSAYLTFVAKDKEGNKVPVRPVLPETDDEKRRYEEADLRRKFRLELEAAKKKLKENKNLQP